MHRERKQSDTPEDAVKEASARWRDAPKRGKEGHATWNGITVRLHGRVNDIRGKEVTECPRGVNIESSDPAIPSVVKVTGTSTELRKVAELMRRLAPKKKDPPQTMPSFDAEGKRQIGFDIPKKGKEMKSREVKFIDQRFAEMAGIDTKKEYMREFSKDIRTHGGEEIRTLAKRGAQPPNVAKVIEDLKDLPADGTIMHYRAWDRPRNGIPRDSWSVWAQTALMGFQRLYAVGFGALKPALRIHEIEGDENLVIVPPPKPEGRDEKELVPLVTVSVQQESGDTAMKGWIPTIALDDTRETRIAIRDAWVVGDQLRRQLGGEQVIVELALKEYENENVTIGVQKDEMPPQKVMERLLNYGHVRHTFAITQREQSGVGEYEALIAYAVGMSEKSAASWLASHVKGMVRPGEASTT